MSFDPSSTDPDVRVSKSQRKRDAHAMLDLARRLVALSPNQLSKIPLPQQHREAVEGAQRITQHVARKRELQYVAKLLREVDAEPIQQALDDLEAPGLKEQARFHRLEGWRDALIESGDPLVNRLCGECHAADRQQLRQLVLKARAELEHERPPAAARKLFKALRELDAQSPLPEPP